MVPSYQGSMLIAAATKLRRMDQFKLSVLLWSRMGETVPILHRRRSKGLFSAEHLAIGQAIGLGSAPAPGLSFFDHGLPAKPGFLCRLWRQP
jgi:hypothetical protein